MFTSSSGYRVAGLIALVAANHLLNAGSLAAQVSKAAPKKTSPSVQLPKVDVTASEGTTATAIRGRPANPAAVKSVNAAIKAVAVKPEVRAALLAEVRRQVRTGRPLALVDGYWVSAIAMAPVYQVPVIRTELVAALGPGAPQLIAAAAGAREGVAVTFTPAQLGASLMSDMLQGVGGIAKTALKGRMTDVTADNVLFVVSYGLGGLGTGSLVDLVRHIMNEGSSAGTTSNNNGDLDGDGIPDSSDADDDGDGYNDDSDHYPRDSSRHICDCGLPAVFLGSSGGADLLPGLVAVLGAARAQATQPLSLGVVAPGQSGSLVLLF